MLQKRHNATKLNQPHNFMLPCPCQSGLTYHNCCQPLHNNNADAETCLALMRSRFCAFYLGSQQNKQAQMTSYLQNTSSQPVKTHDIQANFNLHWQGLHIIDWQQQHDNGYVEFVAIYQQQDQYQQLHEKSQFTYTDQWRYSSGDILASYSFARNKPCWCPSGKKYKHCHGK